MREVPVTIIDIEITDSMREAAQAKADDLGSINRSMLDGKGNMIGFLGEEIMLHKFECTQNNTYDYDIMVGDKKIDVKTKHCTTVPRETYECSIQTYYDQKCDYYVFIRILKDLSRGWILGAIKKDEFMDKAIHYKKGYRDKSNDFTFKADSYNLPISKLYDLVIT